MPPPRQSRFSHHESASDERRNGNQHESEFYYSMRSPPRQGAAAHDGIDMSYHSPTNTGELPSPRHAHLPASHDSGKSYQAHTQSYYRPQAPPTSAYYGPAGGFQNMNQFHSGYYPSQSVPGYQYPTAYYQYPQTSRGPPVNHNYSTRHQGRPQGNNDVPPPESCYATPSSYPPPPMTGHDAWNILEIKENANKTNYNVDDRTKFNDAFNRLSGKYEEEKRTAQNAAVLAEAQAKLDDLGRAYTHLDSKIPKYS